MSIFSDLLPTYLQIKNLRGEGHLNSRQHEKSNYSEESCTVSGDDVEASGNAHTRNNQSSSRHAATSVVVDNNYWRSNGNQTETNSYNSEDSVSPKSLYTPSSSSRQAAYPRQTAYPSAKPVRLPSDNQLTQSSSYMVAFAIAGYCIVSVSIVYLNYWVFTVSFQYPLFVSWIQQLIGLILYHVFAVIGKNTNVGAFKIFRASAISLSVTLKILPLALSFVGMVGAANVCLRYAQVSIYQVARSLTLLMTALLSYIILKVSTSFKVSLTLLLIVLGFVIAALDSSTLTLLGAAFGIISSFCQGLYNVMIKSTLKHVDNDANVMLKYNLLLSSFLFIPLICLTDESKVFYNLPSSVSIYIGILSSGILASTLNLMSYICIQKTSPITFNVVGMAKSCVQSLGGFVFFGDILTLNSALGILLSLIGSILYTFLKMSAPTQSYLAFDGSKGRDEGSAAAHGNEGISTETNEKDNAINLN